MLVVLGACGGGGSGGDGDGPPGGGPDAARAVDADPALCTQTGRYLELATGAEWTFRVMNGTTTYSKTQSVGPVEDVGGAKAGTMAFRLTTTRMGGTTVSWQEDTGDAVIRHRELDQSGANTSDTIFDPYKLRIDEAPAHIVDGATWTLDYTEIVTDVDGTTTVAKSETWDIVGVDEAVSVPAGDYCAIHVHRVSTVDGVPMSGSDKDYWFARGIGKIKERGGGADTEELAAYTPP